MKEKEVALPETVRRTVESRLDTFCETFRPPGVRTSIHLAYRVRADRVTLVELRQSPFDDADWVDVPAVQWRFDPDMGLWSVFRADRNKRWHPVMKCKPSRDFDSVLSFVANEQSGIFWEYRIGQMWD